MSKYVTPSSIRRHVLHRVRSGASESPHRGAFWRHGARQPARPPRMVPAAIVQQKPRHDTTSVRLTGRRSGTFQHASLRRGPRAPPPITGSDEREGRGWPVRSRPQTPPGRSASCFCAWSTSEMGRARSERRWAYMLMRTAVACRYIHNHILPCTHPSSQTLPR